MNASQILRHTALLANEETCAQTARRATEEAFATWHLTGGRDDALLVVSELVTNAYRHGIPPIVLEVSVLPPGHDAPGKIQSDGRACIQVDVRDNSPVMPERRCGGDSGGFGLTVVMALATISYHPEPAGKIVRAVLKLSGADTRKLPSPPQSHELPRPSESPSLSLVVDSVAGKRYLDLIEINALRLRCVIGCREEERRDRSDVIIDLRIGADARPAAASDDLGDAWNYRTPVKTIIARVEDSAYRTIEALAEVIAYTLIVDHHAPYAMVRVHKPGALRFADTVGLMIERTTADFAEEIDDENYGAST